MNLCVFANLSLNSVAAKTAYSSSSVVRNENPTVCTVKLAFFNCIHECYETEISITDIMKMSRTTSTLDELQTQISWKF